MTTAFANGGALHTIPRFLTELDDSAEGPLHGGHMGPDSPALDKTVSTVAAFTAEDGRPGDLDTSGATEPDARTPLPTSRQVAQQRSQSLGASFDSDCGSPQPVPPIGALRLPDATHLREPSGVDDGSDTYRSTLSTSSELDSLTGSDLEREVFAEVLSRERAESEAIHREAIADLQSEYAKRLDAVEADAGRFANLMHKLHEKDVTAIAGQLTLERKLVRLHQSRAKHQDDALRMLHALSRWQLWTASRQQTRIVSKIGGHAASTAGWKQTENRSPANQTATAEFQEVIKKERLSSDGVLSSASGCVVEQQSTATSGGKPRGLLYTVWHGFRILVIAVLKLVLRVLTSLLWRRLGWMFVQ